MGLTRCYKTEGFYLHFICSFSTIFYAISISDTCLRSRKSIFRPNFDKNISIHGRDSTISGLGKRTAAILEFHFRFLFWRMCSHRRVILHVFQIS